MLEDLSIRIIELSGNNRIVAGMLNNEVSRLFCCAIIVYLVFALFFVWKREKGRKQTPSLRIRQAS